MSKKCNRCGREVPDDAIRCPYCTDSGIGVDMTGVSLKDGDETDKAYREAHSDSRPVKQYAPDSVPWLRRTSAVFSVVAVIICCGGHGDNRRMPQWYVGRRHPVLGRRFYWLACSRHYLFGNRCAPERYGGYSRRSRCAEQKEIKKAARRRRVTIPATV